MSYSHAYKAYEHANQTLSHSQQIVLLYAASISYLQQAKEADQHNDHDTRYQLIDRTLSVIRGLRACLDFSANETVATALNNYYEAIEQLLIAVQCDDNKQERCDQIIANLRTIKAAWENTNVTSTPVEEEEVFPRDIAV